MIIRYEDAVARAKENIEIRNYVTKDLSESFSLAVATLDGVHPKTMNIASDRAYFIIEGKAKVEVGDEVDIVRSGDTVYIPKNTVHSIQGKVKYAVINSPPYRSSNEVKPEQGT
jgi:mannose-6-phosphate isomerase-like protein (cupin superfamily)